MRWKGWYLKAILVMAWMVSESSESCPTACVCKWRGGKQTVECLEKALITVPEDIDGETQVLDVSGNNLQIIPREIFYKLNLTNLQKIHLKNCRIGQIGSRAFRGLTNLVELDLSFNLLTAVPSTSFEDAPFLRYLSLANNPILKIEANAFRMALGLIKIDLSRCEIQAISAHAFDRLESLEWLKLNGNKLRELHPKTVDAMEKLHGLEFHDNPWNCDCKLRSLKEWLLRANVAYPVPPVCASPDRISGRVIEELPVDEFACKPQILVSKRYVESAPGENATFTCRVGAVPSPDVHWYWNGRLLLNNSALSAFQKTIIREEGTFEKTSSLTLTNLMDADSGELHCVAENRAGTAEANFTVSVSPRGPGTTPWPLGKGQMAGLGLALAVLLLAILIVASILLCRLRRLPLAKSNPSPSPELPNKNDLRPETKRHTEDPQDHRESGPLSPRRDPFVKPWDSHPGADSIINSPEVLGLFRLSHTSDGHTHNNSHTPDSYGNSTGCAPRSLNVWKNHGFSSDSTMYGSDKTPIIDEDECKVDRLVARCDYPPDYGLPMIDESSSECEGQHRPGIGSHPGNHPPNEIDRLRQRRVLLLPSSGTLDFRATLDDSYPGGCGTDV